MACTLTDPMNIALSRGAGAIFDVPSIHSCRIFLFIPRSRYSCLLFQRKLVWRQAFYPNQRRAQIYTPTVPPIMHGMTGMAGMGDNSTCVTEV